MTDGHKRCISMCILENETEYLLIKRGKRKNTLEDWNEKYIPIGGKIEPYETPENAIIREIKEETGFEIDSVFFLGILTETSPLPKYNNVVYFFSKKVKKQKLKECEEGYLEWVEKTNITNVPTPEIDRVVYKYLEKRQNFIITATYDDKLNLLTAFDYLENKITRILLHIAFDNMQVCFLLN